ncbi:MAG: SDR family oxidoreductase [Myxococcales bacterium]|nr:MAG: SDR family oxidoreductase [Myxococcales bacterium]
MAQRGGRSRSRGLGRDAAGAPRRLRPVDFAERAGALSCHEQTRAPPSHGSLRRVDFWPWNGRTARALLGAHSKSGSARDDPPVPLAGSRHLRAQPARKLSHRHERSLGAARPPDRRPVRQNPASSRHAPGEALGSVRPAQHVDRRSARRGSDLRRSAGHPRVRKGRPGVARRVVPLGAEQVSALLAGRCGLVLGVSSKESVAFQAARQLQALGAEVAVSLRPRRHALAPELTELSLWPVELDARDEGSVAAAIDSVGRHFGRLDFLVHTLVHVPEGALQRPVTELGAAELADAMEVGVRSLLVCAKHALPWLERSPSPRIVTLLSGGADFAMPSYHLIGIVKAALASAVRYLAAELGPRGILCNAVNFSMLETDAARRVIGAERTAQTRQHLAKRALTRAPLDYDDVTRAIAFLVSPLCSNLTGEALQVDGGFSKSYF